MNISDYCAKLDALLTARAELKDRIDLVAQALRQAFSLQADEVAIFTADRSDDVLRFIWPVKLQKSGTIPISSRDSLAARTFRENKAVANNRFAAVYHASIFEHIKQDPAATERPQPIQKILSVPYCGQDGTPVGVIQLSRKGSDANAAGPDFSRDDLALTGEIAKTIGKHL